MNARPCLTLKGRFISLICSRYLRLENCILQCPSSQWRLTHFNATEIFTPNLQFVRHKYGKKQQAQKTEEEADSDSDDETNDFGVKSTAMKTIQVNSLRTDLLIKSGLNVARNKVEKLFFDSRIRVNGKKIFKKSEHVNIGDEIDVIRNASPMNPDFLIVSRIEVLSAKAEDEHIKVKLRRFKTLTVENYAEPWKESSSEEL